MDKRLKPSNAITFHNEIFTIKTQCTLQESYALALNVYAHGGVVDGIPLVLKKYN